MLIPFTELHINRRRAARDDLSVVRETAAHTAFSLSAVLERWKDAVSKAFLAV
jgi:hypothetical protein